MQQIVFNQLFCGFTLYEGSPAGVRLVRDFPGVFYHGFDTRYLQFLLGELAFQSLLLTFEIRLSKSSAAKGPVIGNKRRTHSNAAKAGGFISSFSGRLKSFFTERCCHYLENNSQWLCCAASLAVQLFSVTKDPYSSICVDTSAGLFRPPPVVVGATHGCPFTIITRLSWAVFWEAMVFWSQ